METNRLKMSALGVPKLGVMLASAALTGHLVAASATWDGGGGDNLFGTAANWSGDVGPTVSGDTATWNGTAAGDLSLNWAGGYGANPGGLNILVAGTNTSALRLYGNPGAVATPPTANGGFLALGNTVTVESGAGPVTFGSETATPNTLPASLVFRGNNTPVFTNNSANTVTFGPNLLIQNGGGTTRTVEFAGTGNWRFDNSFQPGGSGEFGLNKTGSGSITLSNGGRIAATSTIAAGNVVVTTAGTFRVSTGLSGAGNLSVTSGGTLGGNGNLSVALQVLAGGTVAPSAAAANGSGNLTFTNNAVTLAGNYSWSLSALSTANPGANFDVITSNNATINIAGSALVLDLGALAPSADSFWGSNQVWTIINSTNGGTLTGTIASPNNSAWASLGAFSTEVVGNNVNLLWTAVPEPSVAITGLLGLGFLAGSRRRK